jgi:hypothetical protein
MALSNYSINAAAVNSPASALEASRDSADIYRSLAEERPDIYSADLAMALNNLSVRLGQADQLDDALSAATESVTIRRGLLAKQDSDREILHGLAGSLSGQD